MKNDTPIDELFFWKILIEDKQEAGEAIPEQMFELLNHAEEKTLYYLIDKYHPEVETFH
jgi:hypothetical protein